MKQLLLRPYPTSQTYRNLKAHGEGVLHVTDDVWLLAQSAVGALAQPPATKPATQVRGFVLEDCCRWYEFRVQSIDERAERMAIECETVHRGWVRDFFGFNRAKHAVLEAAILATRTAFLPMPEIQAEFRRLGVIVQKTGAEQEQRAFDFLKAHIEKTTDNTDNTDEG